MAQSQFFHHIHHIGGFGGGFFQKLQPGRKVVKQVPDHHCGALWTAHRLGVHPSPALNGGPGAQFFLQGFGEQLHLGHRGNGCQGFSPESQSGDLLQILPLLKLTGGVAQKGGGDILPGNAHAVIGNSKVADAPFFQLHGNGGGFGVNGVFQQFLHHRGRALHHLPGGNQLRHLGREQMNFGHIAPSFLR